MKSGREPSTEHEQRSRLVIQSSRFNFLVPRFSGGGLDFFPTFG